MPQIGDKKYGYDEAGMREYIKDKNAMSKAKYGRSHFPLEQADDGKEKATESIENLPITGSKNVEDKDTNNDGIVDKLEKVGVGSTAVTDEGGIPGDIDGDGIPENYVDDETRAHNITQEGIGRYLQWPTKNAPLDVYDEELIADDWKKGKVKDAVKHSAKDIWSGIKNMFSGSRTTTDKHFPTKYKYGGTPSREMGIGGASGQKVPGMYKGNNK